MARKSWKASFAPNAWRASSALSGRVVQTAVSSTSGLASSAGKCDWEAQVARTLAPTNPRRILCAMQHPPQRGDIELTGPFCFTVFPALCIQFDFSTFRLFKGARNPLV
jgi:hypothetical protein